MKVVIKSWVYWIILLLIIIVFIFVFKGKQDGKFYEVTDVAKKLFQPEIDNIYEDIHRQKRKGLTYKLSNRDNILHHDNLPKQDEKRINIQPELPLNFLSEVSLGDPSGIKRSKPERICRETLERIYGKKFSRVKPDWLRNPETNRKLELDCYNDELKIGLEYNGEQHYVWPHYHKMTREQFLAQNRRDLYKLDKCDAVGVYLITVPYNVSHDMIPDYINYYLPHNVEKRQHYGIDT